MHDVGFRTYKDGIFGQVRESKTPQWFRANRNITLDSIKHVDKYTLGCKIKEMFYQLENEIKKYEKFNNN